MYWFEGIEGGVIFKSLDENGYRELKIFIVFNWNWYPVLATPKE